MNKKLFAVRMEWVNGKIVRHLQNHELADW